MRNRKSTLTFTVRLPGPEARTITASLSSAPLYDLYRRRPTPVHMAATTLIHPRPLPITGYLLTPHQQVQDRDLSSMVLQRSRTTGAANARMGQNR